MSEILRACGITKKFTSPSPVEVLRGIDLCAQRGQTIAIVGKSGEGKSTLLHILGTLEKPSGGTLAVCGQEVSSAPLPELRNRHIGFVFQSYNLLEDDTTLSNVLMPARIAGVPTRPGSPAHIRALQLLETVGLKDRAFFAAKLLSGGEKQRAAIARALCNDPSLLLCDEPTGNLDNTHSREIHALLIRLAKEWNKALIVVTHDTELSSLCDQVLLLKDGVIGNSSDPLPSSCPSPCPSPSADSELGLGHEGRGI